MPPKILVIGLDAGTFAVIQPLLDQGKLPHIQKLIQNGVSGDLHSTYPPVTTAAWTTFMTGKNPGKHGIFHFMMRKPNSYDLRLCTARDIHEPTLLDLFADRGFTIGSVNMPMTYPPFRTNGYVIAGVPVPPGAPDIVQPPEFKAELDQLADGDYLVDLDFGKLDSSCSTEEMWSNYQRLQQDIFRMAELQHKTFLYLLDQHPVDLFFAVYYLPDRIQHFFWKFMDRNHALHTKSGEMQFGQIIAEAYQKIDFYISELLQRTDANTTVYIMSDHGATGYYADLNLMYWLEQNGYLVLNRAEKRERVKAAVTLPALFNGWGIGKVSRFLPRFVREYPIMNREMDVTTCIPEIDWGKTRAYATLLGISFNLKGREPLGIVDPGDAYENLVNEIIVKLQQVIDPANPHPLDKMILRREEFCHGEHSHEFCDIFCVLESKYGIYLPCERLDATELFTPSMPGMNVSMSGTHDFDGMFIAYGKNIRKDVKLTGLNISDVAPTMLYLAGYPVLDDMDGRIIVGGIEKDYLNQHPIQMISAPKKDQNSTAYPYTLEQEKVLQDSLRQLGYLE
jgi:predicted AlkP superfamily phosphohydrolase/phosphomutase